MSKTAARSLEDFLFLKFYIIHVIRLFYLNGRKLTESFYY
jgi:hypothetical protein